MPGEAPRTLDGPAGGMGLKGESRGATIANEQSVPLTIDTDAERHIYAYGGSMEGEMFVLVVFRCPSCGSTGKADSWCEGHSAPLECGAKSLKVKREPVLVPHADPERTTTELVDGRT